MKDLPYRPAVGIMLLNTEGRVFVAQRIDSTQEAWQMPQGGIDKGEEPRAAALRELEEETGIVPDLVTIIAEAPKQLDYDLPEDLVAKLWKGKYRGQRQTWYLARYLGTDDQIDLATEHPEFNAWRWVAPDQLPELIVPFKRKLYEAVLASFVSELARG